MSERPPAEDGAPAEARPPEDAPPAKKNYSTEQFRFVDEEAPPEVSGWLSFMHSRAGRRADRRERFRERVVIAGVLVGVVAVVIGLVAWRPWSSAPPADTGDEALGGDRAAVVLQVQQPDGLALFTAILMHDRRDGGRGAAVVVPADLQLPVAGEGRLTVGTALRQAGPTLSREGLGELLGLDLAGSWVLGRGAFVDLVDRVGGLAADPGGGAGRLDGAAAVALAGGADGGGALLAGFAAAFPPTFTASRDLLDDLGVLPAPGLPVEKLGALVSGLARDAAAQRLGLGVLPLDASSRGLDLTAALPLVRDMLGGVPGQGRTDATPRILVQLTPGSGISEADVRADIVNAGYAYVAGGSAPGAAGGTVTVRPTMPDAQALGEAVAKALGLPVSAVRLADDVPFVADVAVVLGPRPAAPSG